MPEHFHQIEVEIAKLRDYCLSETHPRGRHKARIFRSRLGLTTADAEFLRKALLDAARNHESRFYPTESDAYGTRYVLEFEMTTSAGTVTIRSAWIVLTGQHVLRFVTCYVL